MVHDWTTDVRKSVPRAMRPRSMASSSILGVRSKAGWLLRRLLGCNRNGAGLLRGSGAFPSPGNKTTASLMLCAPSKTEC